MESQSSIVAWIWALAILAPFAWAFIANNITYKERIQIVNWVSR